MSSSDNIKVAIKVRPLITREKSENLQALWAVQGQTVYQIDDQGNRYGERYTFDHIFSETTTNENVYEDVVQPIVHSCMEGFNATIFAYGQTSSGKTYTMMGSKNVMGIIQLAVNDVFKCVVEHPERDYLLRCSYIEIYNEKINDLLDKSNEGLTVREDINGRIMHGARHAIVKDSQDVIKLLKQGNKNRKVGFTRMNERSSRSHTILQIIIESKGENTPVQLSQLNLVDLAGSERVAQTQSQGVRLKEGVNINKSLSSLGNVIRQLSKGGGSFVNYRDSQLTRLLQQALGGNARTLIITNITVAAGEETKSTLEFAQRAKLIRNKPEVNFISTSDQLEFQHIQESLAKAYEKIKQFETERQMQLDLIKSLRNEQEMVKCFYNGTSEKESESVKPSRRHTMGAFPSSIPIRYTRQPDLSQISIMSDGKENPEFARRNEQFDIHSETTSTSSDMAARVNIEDNEEQRFIRSSMRATLQTISEDSVLEMNLSTTPEPISDINSQSVDLDTSDNVFEVQDDTISELKGDTTIVAYEHSDFVTTRRASYQSWGFSESDTYSEELYPDNVSLILWENKQLKTRCNALEQSFSELQSFTRLEKLFDDADEDSKSSDGNKRELEEEMETLKRELEMEIIKSGQLQTGLNEALQREELLRKECYNIQHELSESKDSANKFKGTTAQLLENAAAELYDLRKEYAQLEKKAKEYDTIIQAYDERIFDMYNVAENDKKDLLAGLYKLENILQETSYTQDYFQPEEDIVHSVVQRIPCTLDFSSTEEYNIFEEALGNEEPLTGFENQNVDKAAMTLDESVEHKQTIQERELIKKLETELQQKNEENHNMQIKLQNLNEEFELANEKIDKLVVENEHIQELFSKIHFIQDQIVEIDSAVQKLEHNYKDTVDEINSIETGEIKYAQVNTVDLNILKTSHINNPEKALQQIDKKQHLIVNLMQTISDQEMNKENGSYLKELIRDNPELKLMYEQKRDESEVISRQLSEVDQQRSESKETCMRQLAEENCEMKKICDEKNDEIRKLTQRISELQQLYNNNMEELKKATQLLEEQRKTVAEELSEVSNMENKVEERGGRIEELTRQISELEEIISKKDIQIIELELLIKEQKNMNSILSNQISELKIFNDKEKVSNEQLRLQISELKQSFEDIQIHNEELKQQITKLEQSNDDELNNNKTLKQYIADLEQANTELEHSNEEHQIANKDLVQQLSEIKQLHDMKQISNEKLAGEILELKQSFEQGQVNNDELKQQVAKLRQSHDDELDNIKTLKKYIADLEQANTKLEHSNEEQQISNKDLVQQLSEIKQLHDMKQISNEKLVGEILELKQSLEQWQANNDKLKHQIAKLEQSIDGELAKNEKLQVQIAELERVNSEKDINMKIIETQNTELKQTNKEQQVANEKLIQQISEIQKLDDIGQISEEKLAEEILELKRSCEQERINNNELKQKITKLHQSNDDELANNTKLQLKIAELEQEKDINMKTMVIKNTELEKLIQQISEIQKLHDMKQISNEKLAEEILELKQLCEQGRVNNIKLEQQILELKHLSDDVLADNTTLYLKIADLEKENGIHMKAIVTKNTELEKYIYQISEIEKLHAIGQITNEKLAEEILELKRLYEQERVSNSELKREITKLKQSNDDELADKKILEDLKRLLGKELVKTKRLEEQVTKLEKSNSESELENNKKINVQITELQQINYEKDTLIEKLEQQILELKQSFEREQASNVKLKQQITKLRQTHAEKDDHIKRLLFENTELSLLNEEQQIANKKMSLEIEQLSESSNNKLTGKIDLEVKQMEQDIKELKQLNDENQAENKILAQKNSELELRLKEKLLLVEKVDIENDLLIAKLKDIGANRRDNVSQNDSGRRSSTSSPRDLSLMRRSLDSKEKRHNLHDQKRFQSEEVVRSVSISIAIDDLKDAYEAGMCMWHQLDNDITNSERVVNDEWIARSKFFMLSLKSSRDSIMELLDKVKNISEMLYKLKNDNIDVDTLAGKNQQITELESDLLAMKNDLSSLREKNDLLTKDVLETSHKLKICKRSLEAANLQNKQYYKKVSELEAASAACTKRKELENTIIQLKKSHFEVSKKNLDLELEMQNIMQQLQEMEKHYQEKLHKVAKKPATKDIETQSELVSHELEELRYKYNRIKSVAKSRAQEIEKLKAHLGIPHGAEPR